MGRWRVRIAVAACVAALACGESSEPSSPEKPAPTAKPAPEKSEVPAPREPEPARPPEPPAEAPAPAPTPPSEPPQAKAPTPPAEPEAPAISLEELAQRIRETSAIGAFTKLSLKNDIDDLVDALRRYHERKEGDLEMLHARYDALVLKLMTLLEDDEPELALALGRSRKTIWGKLVNPVEFAKLQT
jgi:hypothetical protein